MINYNLRSKDLFLCYNEYGDSMNSRGYTGKELLIVIMIMGVMTMGIIGLTSNAYKDKTEDYYGELVHSMEKQAALYGNTLDSLKEEGHLTITLDDTAAKEKIMLDIFKYHAIIHRSEIKVSPLRCREPYRRSKTLHERPILRRT